jgi:peptidyl-prolyl cis-trans isomerase C
MFRKMNLLGCILATFFLTGGPAVAEMSDDAVVLSADGVQITVEDIERYIEENVPPEKRHAVLNRPNIFKEMAETLYIVRTVAAEAETTEGFDHEQAAWGAKMLHQRRLVDEFRIAYAKEVLKNANWEASAREVYIADSERYQTPEQVKASHILIKTDTRSAEEAQALATELRSRVLSGEDFETLAVEFSEDPSAVANKGSLGFFEFGKMVEPFSEAAFALEKKGDISEVVESPFGYHVIMFVDRIASEPIPFEDVEEQIIDQMQTQLGNKVWQDKITALRSAPGIERDDKLLGEIAAKYK